MDWRADKGTENHKAAHVPALDGLRGVAILLVMLHHCYPSSSGSTMARGLSIVIDAGWIGVELFFVLSGFLITGILMDFRGQPGCLRRFYQRRALRILPLYYAFLIAYQLVATCSAQRLTAGSIVPRSASWPIWLFLTNMPQIVPVGPLVGSLGPLWSLAVEVQIYLIWPMLILLVSRRVLLGVLTAMLPISLFGRLVLLLGWNRVDVVCCWVPAFFDVFAAGGIVAILMREEKGRRLLDSWTIPAMMASGMILAGLTLWLGHFHVWSNPATILGVGRFVLAIFFAAIIGRVVIPDSRSRLNTFLGHRVLRLFGRYSFAMYLFHTPVFATLRPYLVLRLGKQIVAWSVFSGGLIFLATLAVVTLAAAVSWRLLEGPLLRKPPSKADRIKQVALLPVKKLRRNRLSTHLAPAARRQPGQDQAPS